MRYLDAGEFVIAAVCGLVGLLVVFFLGDLLQAVIAGVVLAVIWLGVTYVVRRRKGRSTTSPLQ